MRSYAFLFVKRLDKVSCFERISFFLQVLFQLKNYLMKDLKVELKFFRNILFQRFENQGLQLSRNII